MPGGHASHKGSSIKPNVNAEGQINLDPDVDMPEEIMVNEGYEFDTEAEVNPAAIERPAKPNSKNKH